MAGSRILQANLKHDDNCVKLTYPRDGSQSLKKVSHHRCPARSRNGSEDPARSFRREQVSRM